MHSFHQPTMSLDIFHKIDDERKQRLITYGTPPAILQWDGWHKMTKEDHYRLMFKHEEEHYQPNYTSPKVRGLYYYIGMDPNQANLWKQTSAHSMLSNAAKMINIALTESMMIDVPAAKVPMTPPIMESESSTPATDIALGHEAMMTELGKV
ncbi:hypothetical protein C0993_006826 [Termitomyces sp. T159_Od127]|nr:hypothetical protein C0993_006826 [Termitomyces sp. T159_Od127]